MGGSDACFGVHMDRWSTTDRLGVGDPLFAESRALSIIYEGGGFVQFEITSGQLLEVFGRKNHYYQLHACRVLAFQVEGVRAARNEIQSRGVEFVTDVDGNE